MNMGFGTILLQFSYDLIVYVPLVFCNHAHVNRSLSEEINEKSIYCRENAMH
jgi:hypothetical protein